MFTKLFSSITTSSIWNEDNNTRIVWITMLAMSNKNGYVSASVGGLAHEARVSREDCERALSVLTNPDSDSRSKEFEGRRIAIVDGGFQLLNHPKYRAMRSEEERKEYMKTYMREYRETHAVNKIVNNVSECKPPLAQAEADTEAEADQKHIKEYSNSFLQFWSLYPRKVQKGNALKAWKKHHCESHIEVILGAVASQLTHGARLAVEEKFIPHPASWLNGKGWEDEQTTKKPKVWV